MIGILGAPVLIAGAVSSIMLIAIRYPDRRRTVFTLALLAAPACSSSCLCTRVRPRSESLRSFPMGCGTIVTASWRCHCVRWPSACSSVVGAGHGLAIPATAATVLIMALGTPLTIADGRTGNSSATGGRQRPAAYLSRHYRGGEILADDSAASALIFASDLDLRQFVTSGSNHSGMAITSPARNVAWVVSYPGDAVTSDMTAHPDRFRDFRIKFTEGKIKIFERLPSGTMPVAAKGRKVPIHDGPRQLRARLCLPCCRRQVLPRLWFLLLRLNDLRSKPANVRAESRPGTTLAPTSATAASSVQGGPPVVPFVDHGRVATGSGNKR